MAQKQGIRALPIQVWELGWVSFFNDVCSEMAYPVLALFMAAIGQGPAALGAVEGIAESMVSFMKGASGVHSDIVGKRVPYVRWGYLLTTLGKPVIGLASGWQVVLGGRALDKFGKGIRTTARDTLIVDSAGKERLGAAFGLHRGLDTAGAFIGVLLTLVLLYFVRGSDRVSVYRTIFFISVIPGAIAVLLTLKLRDVRQSGDGQGAGVERKGEAIRPSLREMPAGYWKALALTTIFALANSSDTFLILRANQVFKGYGLATAAILAIWAYALYNAVYAVVSYPAGELSDKIGRWWVLGVGWLIYAAVYAGFGSAGTWQLWILFAFYGIYIGLTDGVSKALVGDFAPKHAKGTAMGFYYMVTGFATLAASGAMGVIWAKCGFKLAFEFEAALAVLAVLAIPVATVGKKRGNALAESR